MGDAEGQRAKLPGSTAARVRAGANRPAGSGPVEADLQTLLIHGLERVAIETRAEAGAVWARDINDELRALAVRGARVAPSDAHWAALAALRAPTDLGAPGAPDSLRALPREGLSAAAPLSGPDGDVLGVVLLGGALDPPGRVRPRTLAALGAAASRLGDALAGARAAARLSRLDDHVRRLDRLAALGELTAEIVHEIRNPLVSVKTFLQLLPERADDPAFREEFHAVAEDELRRVERLLDVVLAQARPEPPARAASSGSLREAAESVLQLVSHRAAVAGVELRLDAPAGAGPHAALSEDALRQVMLNLVLNAIDACPAGGTVRLALAGAAGSVELRVEDDGPGVPPELRERVFEPFFSSRPDRPGGLGLAISRRVVEEAGGRLDALQTPAGGGCFRVELPQS